MTFLPLESGKVFIWDIKVLFLMGVKGEDTKKAMTFTGYRSKSSIGISSL